MHRAFGPRPPARDVSATTALSAHSSCVTAGHFVNYTSWERTAVHIALRNTSSHTVQVSAAHLVYPPATPDATNVNLSCNNWQVKPHRPYCLPRRPTVVLEFDRPLNEHLDSAARRAVADNLGTAALHVTYRILGYPPFVTFRAVLPLANHHPDTVRHREHFTYAYLAEGAPRTSSPTPLAADSIRIDAQPDARPAL